MRVIAGSARSMPLKTPIGTITRPTSDRIKETLFNMLAPSLQDSIFIDLFSGSGGIGIEAISRGSAKVYFIDNDAKAISCIQDNLEFTKLKDKAIVLRQDATSALSNIFEKEIDIIYIDPPYMIGLEEMILSSISKQNYITPMTMIIFEADLKTDFSFVTSYGFDIVKEKKYKTNKHIFLAKKGS